MYVCYWGVGSSRELGVLKRAWQRGKVCVKQEGGGKVYGMEELR